MNGDGKGDLLVGCFNGFLHYLPATDSGFSNESWLKDEADQEIHTGQYWSADERKWIKTTLVTGVPDNILGIYPDLKDWDNDGDLDLMIGGRRGAIGLRINEGSAKEPKFSATPLFVEASGKPIDLEGHVSTDLVDLDGDGLRDLICAQDGGEITWYRNSGNEKTPKFTEPVKIVSKGVEEPVGYLRINAADMNGDGKPDLLVGANDAERVHGIWVFYQK